MEQLLDAILELIRLVLAQILDPRTIMSEFGRLHGALDHGIVDAIEFEREEQQMHRRVGQPLGNVAIEFGDRGIDAVAGMNQARHRTRAAPRDRRSPRSAAPLRRAICRRRPCRLCSRACLCNPSQTRRIRRPSFRGRARLPARRYRNRDRPGSIPATCRFWPWPRISGLRCGRWRSWKRSGDCLGRAGEEREVILFEPVFAFQPERMRRCSDDGTTTFKRALIGISQSARFETDSCNARGMPWLPAF